MTSAGSWTCSQQPRWGRWNEHKRLLKRASLRRMRTPLILSHCFFFAPPRAGPSVLVQTYFFRTVWEKGIATSLNSMVLKNLMHLTPASELRMQASFGWQNPNGFYLILLGPKREGIRR